MSADFSKLLQHLGENLEEHVRRDGMSPVRAAIFLSRGGHAPGEHCPSEPPSPPPHPSWCPWLLGEDCGCGAEGGLPSASCPTGLPAVGRRAARGRSLMPRRMLVVYRIDEPKPLLKLEVLNADMPHPGWMRFELKAGAPAWEEPTVCWYRVPPEASVELQSEVTDADVMARVAEQPEGTDHG